MSIERIPSDAGIIPKPPMFNSWKEEKEYLDRLVNVLRLIIQRIIYGVNNLHYHDDFVDVASGATVTFPLAINTFNITGTADITSILASWPGRVVTIKFAGNAATNGVVDGGNLKLAGNFAYTADDTMQLICDGINWYEVSRSAN